MVPAYCPAWPVHICCKLSSIFNEMSLRIPRVCPIFFLPLHLRYNIDSLFLRLLLHSYPSNKSVSWQRHLGGLQKCITMFLTNTMQQEIVTYIFVIRDILLRLTMDCMWLLHKHCKCKIQCGSQSRQNYKMYE